MQSIFVFNKKLINKGFIFSDRPEILILSKKIVFMKINTDICYINS